MIDLNSGEGAEVLSVSELNRRSREILEQGFPLLWVSGEISNFTQAASGHWYFSLKDGKAQVRCAMFRHKSQYLGWAPANGMQLEVRAQVTLYEARGEFQLNVEDMRRAGLGALYEAFEKLKARLEKEGLFAAARKKALPAFPGRIGIITSPAAAALRDVLTTLRRRMPSIPVIIYPAPVQGAGAGAMIAAAIETAGRRAECDVLILCRGGGSIEDLWAFNEEAVARAVFASPIPVVCGVGHETDFTIADFAADRRAPTPTAAAEMASPNRSELLHRLGLLHARLSRHLLRSLEQRMQQLDYLSRRLIHPARGLQNRQQHLQHLGQRMRNSAAYQLESRRWQLRQLSQRLAFVKPDMQAREAHRLELALRLKRALQRYFGNFEETLKRLNLHLAHLSPQSVLERGYSIVETEDGGIVKDSAGISVGDALKITFARGRAGAQVTNKQD